MAQATGLQGGLCVEEHDSSSSRQPFGAEMEFCGLLNWLGRYFSAIPCGCHKSQFSPSCKGHGTRRPHIMLLSTQTGQRMHQECIHSNTAHLPSAFPIVLPWFCLSETGLHLSETYYGPGIDHFPAPASHVLGLQC